MTLNLVFLNYWQFLNKKTHVNNVFIDKLNEDMEYNENNFVNNIKNYKNEQITKVSTI